MMMFARPIRAAVFSTGMLLIALGCGGTDKTDSTDASPLADAATSAGTASSKDASGTASSSVSWGRITAEVPEGWVGEPPSNSMRAAQFRLPKVDGDSDGGEVVLSFFGQSQGGSLEMNLQRWAGMIKSVDGSSSTEAMKTETREVGSLTVITADISGIYAGSVDLMNPSAGKHIKPSYRMFNIIFQSSAGNHFAKVLGPKATIDRWMPSIEAFIASARPE